MFTISSSFQNSLKTSGHRGYEFLEFHGIAVVCGFALSCWNTQGLPWNTRHLEGSICCSKTFIYLSAFIVPSKTCKLPIPYALMHPHTFRDAGFWTERWLHARRSPSSLARRTRRPWFPTRMSNLDMSDHRTLFHFETVNDRIMPMSDAVSSEGPKNKGLRPCPLHTDISPVSLKLLMMLCTVDDEICKAFTIWHWAMLFLKYSTIFLLTLSQIGEPLPIFTSERLCLSKTSLLCYRPDVN